jgi:hypothetical protein
MIATAVSVASKFFFNELRSFLESLLFIIYNFRSRGNFR